MTPFRILRALDKSLVQIEIEGKHGYRCRDWKWMRSRSKWIVFKNVNLIWSSINEAVTIGDRQVNLLFFYSI